MSNSENILYEKKYPSPIEMFEDAENNPVPESLISESRKKFTAEEMYRRIKEESVFVPRPDREESTLLFQKLAIYYSELYEISVKVARNEYSIYAEYTLYSGIYTADMVKSFSDLLKMSDDISFNTFTTDEEDGITISLYHNTHDYFLSGNLIN